MRGNAAISFQNFTVESHSTPYPNFALTQKLVHPTLMYEIKNKINNPWGRRIQG